MWERKVIFDDIGFLLVGYTFTQEKKKNCNIIKNENNHKTLAGTIGGKFSPLKCLSN